MRYSSRYRLVAKYHPPTSINFKKKGFDYESWLQDHSGQKNFYDKNNMHKNLGEVFFYWYICGTKNEQQIQSQDNLHHQADTIFREILSYERNAGKQEHLSRENQVEVIVKLP